MQEIVDVLSDGIEENKEIKDTIQKVLKTCFEEEHIEGLNLYITVTLTTPEKIRELNQVYRNIDKETDVLSFPMFEREELQEKIKNNQFTHEDVLGDIVISIEQVKKQAVEYGHSFERELSYMMVHGFYHLMGYDHMTEEEKKEMREKEDKVLGVLKITR